MLNGKGESGHLALFPIVGKTHSFAIKYYAHRELMRTRHCQVEEVPFYSKFISSFYHERVVGFVQSIFCIYRNAHVSLPGTINMVHDSFSDVKPTLHS